MKKLILTLMFWFCTLFGFGLSIRTYQSLDNDSTTIVMNHKTDTYIIGDNTYTMARGAELFYDKNTWNRVIKYYVYDKDGNLGAIYLITDDNDKLYLQLEMPYVYKEYKVKEIKGKCSKDV